MPQRFNSTNQNQTEQNQEVRKKKSLINKIIISLIIVIVLCVGGILYLSFSKQLQQIEEEKMKEVDFNIEKIIDYDWDSLITEEKIKTLLDIESITIIKNLRQRALENGTFVDCDIFLEDLSQESLEYMRENRHLFKGDLSFRVNFHEEGMPDTLIQDSIDLYKELVSYDEKKEILEEAHEFNKLGQESFYVLITKDTETECAIHFIRKPFEIFVSGIDYELDNKKLDKTILKKYVTNISSYIDGELTKILGMGKKDSIDITKIIERYDWKNILNKKALKEILKNKNIENVYIRDYLENSPINTVLNKSKIFLKDPSKYLGEEENPSLYVSIRLRPNSSKKSFSRFKQLVKERINNNEIELVSGIKKIENLGTDNFYIIDKYSEEVNNIFLYFYNDMFTVYLEGSDVASIDIDFSEEDIIRIAEYIDKELIKILNS